MVGGNITLYSCTNSVISLSIVFSCYKDRLRIWQIVPLHSIQDNTGMIVPLQSIQDNTGMADSSAPVNAG